jgi:excisionase family DNA binding protein
MQSELLTIPEFCAQVNVGRTNAYRLINEGQVKAVKLGKKTLIPRTEMLRWIENLQPYASENAEA